MDVHDRLVESDVDEETDSSTTSTEIRPSKCRSIFSFLTVEPIVFIVSFGFGIQSIIGQDLLIFKACHVNLGYDKDVCANLSAHPSEQVEVQKLSATISMYSNILTAVPTIIMSLFLGPWSDYHGRKPLLISSICGFLFYQLVYIACCFFTSLKAEYLLFTSLSNVFGGFTCLLIGIYGYIADVTKLRSRTSRVAFVDLFLFFAVPLGIFLSDFIFRAGGFFLIFGIGFLFFSLALLYTIFCIKETRERNVSDAPEARVRLFAIENVTSVFRTVFKRRDNGLRTVLLLLLLAMMLNVSGYNDSGTTYLYTRLKFSWTEHEFSRWVSSVAIIRSLATFSIMPILSLKLQVHDALIGLLGSVLAIAGTLVYAFADKWWMMYLGAGICIFSSTPAIVIRSMITKVVPKTELGKVFSLLSSLEAAAPFLLSPIIVNIYNSTINVYAGAIFFVFASIFILVSLALISIYFLLKRLDGGYDSLHNEGEHITTRSEREEANRDSSVVNA